MRIAPIPWTSDRTSDDTALDVNIGSAILKEEWLVIRYEYGPVRYGFEAPD
jgi:hypothetical protein